MDHVFRLRRRPESILASEVLDHMRANPVEFDPITVIQVERAIREIARPSGR